jgi:hypothetical protein
MANSLYRSIALGFIKSPEHYLNAISAIFTIEDLADPEIEENIFLASISCKSLTANYVIGYLIKKIHLISKLYSS